MRLKIVFCRLHDSPVPILTHEIGTVQRAEIRKHLRRIGAAYIDTKGEPKGGRAVGATCPITCYYACQINFDVADRLRIHKQYWQSTAEDKQTFYATYVNRIPKHVQTTKAKSRRTFTFVYYFQLGEKRFQVCQKFFLNTLNVCGRVVYRAFNKKGRRKLIKMGEQ